MINSLSGKKVTFVFDSASITRWHHWYGDHIIPLLFRIMPLFSFRVVFCSLLLWSVKRRFLSVHNADWCFELCPIMCLSLKNGPMGHTQWQTLILLCATRFIFCYSVSPEKYYHFFSCRTGHSSSSSEGRQRLRVNSIVLTCSFVSQIWNATKCVSTVQQKNDYIV